MRKSRQPDGVLERDDEELTEDDDERLWEVLRRAKIERCDRSGEDMVLANAERESRVYVNMFGRGSDAVAAVRSF